MHRPFFPLGAALPIFALAVVAAAADEIPRRKAGLWRIEHAQGAAARVAGPIETCVDEKTDDLLRQRFGAQEQQCEKMSFRREGDKYRMSSVCKIGDRVATTEGTFTGSFDSAYRAELHVTFDPPLSTRAASDIVMEAKWLGPCKPGQKPGDVDAPALKALGGTGGKMNMQELMKMRDQLRKGAQ
ncbi:hypothetical protein MSC49_04540 [Methylosinus sp. C49]|uniref:DUF3617 domain-containing protein n=1 Tax=Methylosinus sp. C49 TaxID=2699395 RepID=UPI001366D308|nr:DUF3617 family protein [Methylosinus sp. C49]BBU60519.1 hypothetical protein MSC49_04540 [Methylosinus sp. C49]